MLPTCSALHDADREQFTPHFDTHALDASATAALHSWPTCRSAGYLLQVQLRVLNKGSFSHQPERIFEKSTFGDMFITLQYIQVISLLFGLGCSTPTSLVFSSPENAVKDPPGAVLSNPLSLNVSLATSRNITNATRDPAPFAFSDPNVTTLSDYIRYKVRSTKVTIDAHSFRSHLLIDEALATIALALTRVLRHCVAGRGRKPITGGYFRYTHEFDGGNVTRLSIADFRERCRPITWLTLADTLKGLTDFMKEPDRGYRVLSFEVEEDGVGYEAPGYLELLSSTSSTFV